LLCAKNNSLVNTKNTLTCTSQSVSRPSYVTTGIRFFIEQCNFLLPSRPEGLWNSPIDCHRLRSSGAKAGECLSWRCTCTQFKYPYWLRCLQLTLVCPWESQPCLVCDSNRCILVKSTLGWNAVVFCAWENVQLCCVVLCVVTAVHTFGFRLVIKEACNKWRPILIKKNYVMQWWKLMFLTRYTTCFPLTVVADVKCHYPRCAGHVHSLE
jgi:hypothetical protein